MKYFELINRIRRHLGFKTSKWKINGRWYTFYDCRGSITPLIVYKEIERGFYNIRLQPSDVVVDIGAHVGIFSIPLARENPKVKFYCYEPNPINYYNLLTNILINKVRNITPVKAGLSKSSNEKLVSIRTPTNSGGAYTKTFFDGPNPYHVPKKDTIDGFSPGYTLKEMRKIHNPSVIKIDVEGAEYGAININNLKGLDYLIMEIHGHLGDAKEMLEITQTVNDHRLMVIHDPTIEGIYINKKKLPLKANLNDT